MSDKLEKISEDITEIKTNIAVMKVDVAHHIKRSDQHEEIINYFYEELKPIKIKISQLDGAYKFLGILAGVPVFLYYILKLFGS